MSLTVSLEYECCEYGVVEKHEVEVFCRNITHNLNKMADEAGIYEAL